MSGVSPVSAQIALLLAKYTPEQIAGFVDDMSKVQQEAAQPAAASAAATPQRKNRSKKMAVSKAAQKVGAAPARTSNNIAPTRPLNSWMAFRSKHQTSLSLTFV